MGPFSVTLDLILHHYRATLQYINIYHKYHVLMKKSHGAHIETLGLYM